MELCRVLLLLAWLWISAYGEEAVSCVFTETCVLPCSFENAEDLQFIEWYKDEGGGLVHALMNSVDMLQNQAEAFRGRTAMFPKQVSGGNASLQLSALRVSDEGKYLCRVVRDSADQDMWVTLGVEDPVKTVSLEWKGDVLVCSSEGMYPPPNVSWTPLSEHQTHVKQIQNQLYSISSSLPLDLQPPQQFTCNISTRSSWKSATYSLQPSLEMSTNIIIPCVDSMVPEKSLRWTFKYIQTIVTRSGAEVTCTAPWRPFVKSVSDSGSLSLKELSVEQEGVYICELQTEDHTYISRTELRNTGHTAFSPTWLIIPVALIIIFVIIGVIYLVRRKKEPINRDDLLLTKVCGETNILHRMLHCIFEDLSKDQLDKFKSFLSNQSLMQEFSAIPRNNLHEKEDICKAMTETYGIQSINVTKRILQNLQRNDLLEFMKGDLIDGDRSPTEWSLQSPDPTLEQFDLRKYYPTEKVLLALLLVVKDSSKAILSGCHLSDHSCGPLASVLSSSSLKHLDLSNNDLQDSGVKQLCEGLKNDRCKLETLSLCFCGLSALSCAPLASVLRSSSLKHLDLSNNNLQDSGVELLCVGLKSSTCRLETLKLSGCLVSERGGDSLATALSSALPHLRELDLSYNHLGASAEFLTSVWDSQRNLDSLRLHPDGECWMVPGLRKYACKFFLEPNTAHKNLRLSEDNRCVTYVWEEQPYPDHDDRFTHWEQVLSSTSLRGRCYWEVVFSGKQFKEVVSIALSYNRIKRTGRDSQFGMNDHSWSLSTWENHFIVRHNGEKIFLSYPFSFRVAMFLDTEAGVLSFYQIHSDEEQSHLHTFNTTFTEEELFPGFEVGYNSEVTLVNMNS